MERRSALPDQGGPERSNPLIAKLETLADLGVEDRRAIVEACRNTRAFAASSDIISEGDKPGHIHIMVEGWAARYKIVRDGGRQITAFVLPGDFCDLHTAILGEMDHSIVALTRATVAFVPPAEMEALPRWRPDLAKALWWATLVDEAVLRSWIVNLGRRDAYEGVAHLMCELHARLENVGLVDDGRFSLPLTQEDLADALGLTPIHTNRVLQRLRAEGLITLKGGTLDIPDVHRLRRVAGFDSGYLHLQRPPR